VAKDALAEQIFYNENDYKSISNLQTSFSFSNFVPLYNGNIVASMLSQDTLTPLLRTYRYDGLNRLREQNVLLWQNNVLNATTSWNTAYTYDRMGNLFSLKRNAQAQQTMDMLQYHYYPNTNKLAYVTDTVPDGMFTQDIDNQYTNSYRYDKVGNLIIDNSELLSMQWTDYGKLKRVNYPFIYDVIQPTPAKLTFTYDAMANRLTKTYWQKTGNINEVVYTQVYVRDVQGNPIATYKISEDSLYLDELYIYGSQRIGVLKADKFLAKQPTVPPYYDQFDIKSLSTDIVIQPLPINKKRYELTDWLGNVRVVITDRKLHEGTHYKPDVVSVSDYYPFGSAIAERSYEVKKYNYGFNGQEKDNEITGTTGSHLAFEFREYDSRVGRFFAVDPLTSKYPYWTPYAFAGNRPIDGIDLEGLEWKPTQGKDKNYTGFEWDPKNAYDAKGNLKSGYYKTAILFSEKDDTPPTGEVKEFHATATVYKAEGTTGSYDATTLPSNTDDYGTVAPGLYKGLKGTHPISGGKRSYTALNLYTLPGSRNLPAVEGNNPATGNSYVSGVNVHKPGIDDFLGISSKGKAMSEGCFLIKQGTNNTLYDDFMNNFSSGENIGVVLMRKTQPKLQTTNTFVIQYNIMPVDNTYVAHIVPLFLK